MTGESADTGTPPDPNQPLPARADTPPGMDPVKWAQMNRAERRAFLRTHRQDRRRDR